MTPSTIAADAPDTFVFNKDVFVGTDDLGRRGTTRDCDGNCRIFYVNYVVLTSKYAVTDSELASEAALHVEWLNEKFRTQKGYQLFEFRLKSYIDAKDSLTKSSEVERVAAERIDKSVCPKLRALGDLGTLADNLGDIFPALAECLQTRGTSARRLFSKDAINIYIYDAVDTDGSTSIDGRGGRAKGTAYGFPNDTDRWPYVFLDYVRFSSTSTYANFQAAQEHEVGHAFGLQHVCVKNATSSTTTSIMATGGSLSNGNDCAYEAGDRTVGFANGVESDSEGTWDQISTIQATADEHAALLGSPTPSSPAQW